MADSQRPTKGLDAEAALKRWSDPAAYQELADLSDGENAPTYEDLLTLIGDHTAARLHTRKREALEAAFRRKLVDGTVLATGIDKYGSARELIDPDLWEVTEIFYDGDCSAVGGNRIYGTLQFFGRSDIPLNARWLPSWLADELKAGAAEELVIEPTYQHVSIGTTQFTFGAIQARVIKLLHEAQLTDDRWLNGKKLLEQAGSSQAKMIDVFKSQPHWKMLIDSDGRGGYRLRPPVTAKS